MTSTEALYVPSYKANEAKPQNDLVNEALHDQLARPGTTARGHERPFGTRWPSINIASINILQTSTFYKHHILQTSTFYKYQHFTSIDILQTSTFYKHLHFTNLKSQHFTNINILQTSTFYKSQHFTNINITNINISNINISNMNIASINIHHFKEQKFIVVEVFQYSLLRALKLDVEF